MGALVSRASVRVVWLALLTLFSSEALSAGPRVLSINLCTDQLVMLLADRQQIVGLSTLSRDKAGSVFHEQAAMFAQVEPVAEDILRLSPDLVITGPYTSRYTLALLDELGIRVETVDIAQNIESAMANVLLVGKLLNQQARARQLVSDAEHRLTRLSERVAQLDALDNQQNRHKPRAGVYDTNGDQSIVDYGVIGLEQMIKLKPDALVESPYSKDTYSRGQILTEHPALQQAGLNPRFIDVPSNQTICAGPWTLDVVERLVDARAEL